MALYSQSDAIDMYSKGLFPKNLCIAILVPGQPKRFFVRHDMQVIEATDSFYPDALSRTELPQGALFVGCCYPQLQDAEHTYAEPLDEFWMEEKKRQLTPPPSLAPEVDVPVKKIKLLKEAL